MENGWRLVSTEMMQHKSATAVRIKTFSTRYSLQCRIPIPNILVSDTSWEESWYMALVVLAAYFPRQLHARASL